MFDHITILEELLEFTLGERTGSVFRLPCSDMLSKWGIIRTINTRVRHRRLVLCLVFTRVLISLDRQANGVLAFFLLSGCEIRLSLLTTTTNNNTKTKKSFSRLPQLLFSNSRHEEFTIIHWHWKASNNRFDRRSRVNWPSTERAAGEEIERSVDWTSEVETRKTRSRRNPEELRRSGSIDELNETRRMTRGSLQGETTDFEDICRRFALIAVVMRSRLDCTDLEEDEVSEEESERKTYWLWWRSWRAAERIPSDRIEKIGISFERKKWFLQRDKMLETIDSTEWRDSSSTSPRSSLRREWARSRHGPRKRESRISLPFGENLRREKQIWMNTILFVATGNGRLTEIDQWLSGGKHLRSDQRPERLIIQGKRKILFGIVRSARRRRRSKDVYFERVMWRGIDSINELFHRWTKFQIDFIHGEINFISKLARSVKNNELPFFCLDFTFLFFAIEAIRTESLIDAIAVDPFCSCRILQPRKKLFPSLNHWATNLSLNRFDCLPIREAKQRTKKMEEREERECWPSMDIPICRHFSNRHDRQMIFDVETISHRLFSEQKYRSGAFSLVDRRKNPCAEQAMEGQRDLLILLYTLHKWQPQSECPMPRLHTPDKATSCTNLHFSVHSLLSIDGMSVTVNGREKCFTGDLHSDGETLSESTVLTLSSTSFGDQAAQLLFASIFLLSIHFHRDRTQEEFLNAIVL